MNKNVSDQDVAAMLTRRWSRMRDSTECLQEAEGRCYEYMGRVLTLYSQASSYFAAFESERQWYSTVRSRRYRDVSP